MKRSIAFLALAAAVLWYALPATAQMKAPIPLTAAQFSASAPGAQVTLAVRVVSRERDLVRATVLERRDDAHYRATGTSVSLYLADQTPIVMGSAADVRAGTVLFVDAIATTPGRADVKRATVVTSYVTVE